MLLSSNPVSSVRFIPFKQDSSFPSAELTKVVYHALSERKESRVAIFAANDFPYSLPDLGAKALEPRVSYNWSGFLRQRKVGKPPGRVLIGDYSEWFQWYMRHLRFRTFHTIVLIEPLNAIADEEHGGYIDGLLARLVGKVRQVILVAKGGISLPVPDETRVKEILRALLYGTRLSRPELMEQVSRTFIPIPKELLDKTFERYKYHWRISKDHPRFQLDEFDEELLQGMVANAPSGYIDGKPDQIEQLFWRKRRFRRELRIPDEMLRENALETIKKMDWATVPYEALKASEWLEWLNKSLDSRLEAIYNRHEHVDNDQWLALLSPTRKHVRRIMEGLVAEGKLDTRQWFREIGRPATAYHLPGKFPFLDERCGQCAFYVSVKRKCRLWWPVNKKRVFFDERWKQTGSPVTRFEIHKMRYASRIGPHSSACTRFIDKKRDHLRKEIPEKCEICAQAIQGRDSAAVTCPKCATRYVRFRGKVKVMTAYEHEYDRLYREITGGDAKADLEAWKRETRTRLSDILRKKEESEDLDVLAEEAEPESEPPGVWPQFDKILQEKVDELARTTVISKRLSMAMAQSTLNATQRIVAIANLHAGDVGPAMTLQEKYLTLISDTNQRGLLTYEALSMKQYWRCYGLALRKAQQWFGPRKRSRFVMEFVEDPAGRAKGYSAVDAAINYLHQRRLRQAERINAEVGFPGTCDGFLHRERYNSRGIGLLLDMIDPFKFADREELLVVALNGGISWTDFRLERDRRGSTYYYPGASATAKLNRAGFDADNKLVSYQNRDLSLSEAFKQYASSLHSLLESVSQNDTGFEPFVFAPSSE